MIYSNDTYDITNDISTYLRRDFNSVFDTSRNKWFMLNNLGNYEEYGIYGTDFSSHYVGKLVEVNGHEYEWDGTEWDDLGADGGGKPKEYPTKAAPTITNYWNSRVFRNGSLIVKALQGDELLNLKYKDKNVLIKSEHEEDPYNTNAYLSLTGINDNFSDWPRFVTDLHLKNTYTIEVKCKPISMSNQWKLLWGSYDDNNMDHNGFAWLKSGNGSTRYSQAFWNYNVGSRVLNLNFTDMDNNTIYTIITEVGTGNTTINGGSTISGNGNNISGTLTSYFQIGCVQTLYTDGGFNGQIYYVKITEGNTLVAYYQADNTYNTPGFVDLVSGIKYTNSGSGTVTYGEDV